MAISSIPSPIHNPKLCTDAPPRTLDQFESRREVLFALRDAIAAHQVKWNASQVAHGNISTHTICIGDAKSPGTRGFLINLEDSNKPNGDPTFQSAAVISRDIFPNSKISHFLDYFDDLESFYYVLAYICIAFTEPHSRHPNLPRTVSAWATNPRSEESVLAKRAIMTGSGIEYGHIQPYFGTFIFETLLEDWHTILKYRHEKRAAREFCSSPVTKVMLRKESDEDYEDLLERLDWAIEVMEDFGDGQFDEIDTQMTTFKVDREPSMEKEGGSST